MVFPLANIRVPANILSFTTSSVLVFSVAASSALRIGLASPASSALLIGTMAYRTGNRSNPCNHDSIWTYRKGVPPNLAFRCSTAVRPVVSLSRKQPILEYSANIPSAFDRLETEFCMI